MAVYMMQRIRSFELVLINVDDVIHEECEMTEELIFFYATVYLHDDTVKTVL